MAILKAKIARALQKQPSPILKPIPLDSLLTTTKITRASQKTTKPLPVKTVLASKKKAQIASDTSSTCSSPTNKKERSPNKNIVKNYARAMINFALSELAGPYLEKIIEDQEEQLISLNEFKTVLQDQKEKINSIVTLRALLLITEQDNVQTVAFKEVFRDICETFVKLFSVNWIFSSKLSDKMIHLKYRFKILRRIRNPELFTYLENFNKRH